MVYLLTMALMDNNATSLDLNIVVLKVYFSFQDSLSIATCLKINAYLFN